MKTKLLSISLLLCMSAAAQGLDVTGTAEVLSTAGRTSCDYVQLWEGGPRWATFNVGATITDYAHLTVGADATVYDNYQDQAPYYNTANVGGLYPWNNSNLNGRNTTWIGDIATGIADVATTLWGDNWETPTIEQLDTLQDTSYGKTVWTWCDGSTTQYVEGCTLAGSKVTGVGEYADYSIFLPAAGYFDYEGTVYNVSFDGNYWSSNILSNSDNAWFLYCQHYKSNTNRMYGQTVRAVLVESESQESGYMTQKDVKTAPATKTVRDGQLLIQRDGRTYNAQGARVNL